MMIAQGLFCWCFFIFFATASAQPDPDEIVETIPCRSCYIHPDSRDMNLAYCDTSPVQCPVYEGCWELKMEEYTISGCMKDVTSQHSGASPVYSEKDMTYCTQFWRDGACTRGEMCLSCSTASHLTIEMGVLMAIISLQTIQLMRLL